MRVRVRTEGEGEGARVRGRVAVGGVWIESGGQSVPRQRERVICVYLRAVLRYFFLVFVITYIITSRK